MIYIRSDNTCRGGYRPWWTYLCRRTGDSGEHYIRLSTQESRRFVQKSNHSLSSKSKRRWRSGFLVISLKWNFHGIKSLRKLVHIAFNDIFIDSISQDNMDLRRILRSVACLGFPIARPQEYTVLINPTVLTRFVTKVYVKNYWTYIKHEGHLQYMFRVIYRSVVDTFPGVGLG